MGWANPPLRTTKGLSSPEKRSREGFFSAWRVSHVGLTTYVTPLSWSNLCAPRELLTLFVEVVVLRLMPKTDGDAYIGPIVGTLRIIATVRDAEFRLKIKPILDTYLETSAHRPGENEVFGRHSRIRTGVPTRRVKFRHSRPALNQEG